MTTPGRLSSGGQWPRSYQLPSCRVNSEIQTLESASTQQ